jgi:hypothetical protein
LHFLQCVYPSCLATDNHGDIIPFRPSNSDYVQT